MAQTAAAVSAVGGIPNLNQITGGGGPTAIAISRSRSSSTARVQWRRNTSSLDDVYWRKADNDDDDPVGGWCVNDNGGVFAGLGEDYYALDTAELPELQNLPPGDYTHEDFAALVAEAEEVDE
jgi:hypothetical protein